LLKTKHKRQQPERQGSALGIGLQGEVQNITKVTAGFSKEAWKQRYNKNAFPGFKENDLKIK
jgi:hypothetical protein